VRITVTRRAFLKRVAVTGGTLATASAVAPPFAVLLGSDRGASIESMAINSVASARTPLTVAVVTFFDGQLWLDTSGTSIAYQPPLGARAAAPLAHLTDAELRNVRGYI